MTDLNQALATTGPTAPPTGKALIKFEVERYKPVISRALPASYDGGADRFVESVMNAIRTEIPREGKPSLATCTPLSIVGSALHAAQLGLEIGPLQQAYLIPRAGLCTFQLGYKGLIKLASFAGYETDAHPVYEGDTFDFAYGTEAHLKHVPRFQSTTATLYWAMATNLANRHGRFLVMDKPAIEHARKSAAPGSQAWRDHYDSMARKTVIKALLQLVPLSTRAEALQAAMDTDGIARTELEAAPSDFEPVTDTDVVDAEVLPD